MSGETLIQLALGIPALGALGIAMTASNRNLREGVTLVTAGALFWVVVVSLLPMVLAGARPEWDAIDIVGGVGIAFAIEPLGMLFACIASTLWIVNSIYSVGYMRGNDEPRQTGFYICFAIAISSAMGIAFAGNLFTLFLFYEVLTVSTYPLVTHKGNQDAREKGRIYILLLMATSMMLLLPAIIWTYVVAGTADFTTGGILAGAGLSAGALTFMVVLYVFGIGKAAVMPMHFWLPAAMVAPTPVSALLHAVAVVKAGVFTVLKVMVYIFGLDLLAETGASQIILYAAGATVIIASVIALMQDNLKKRLAFSTVSQLSYIVMAAAVPNPISIIGAALHMASHAVSKITLFFAAGSIYTAAHKTEISQLDGIGRRQPWTMVAFAIGALAMIGVPPTATFISKWFMIQADMATENWFALAVIIISTCMNAAYFLPIVWRAFWRAPPVDDPDDHPHGEAPWPIVLALSITASLTLLLFFFPGTVFSLAEAIVAEVP